MRVEYVTFDPVAKTDGPIHTRIDTADGKRMFWPTGTKTQTLLYPAFSELDFSDHVVLTEGEHAADAVKAAGRSAFGTVCGAGSIPTDAVLMYLAGFRLILWPDRDAIGRKHMGRIGRKLEEMHVWSLRVIRPLDGPDDGQDAADLPPNVICAMIDAVIDRPPIGPLS